MSTPKSPYHDPNMDNNQAARRLVRNVNRTCASYQREYETATRTRSLHTIKQANHSRAVLAEDIRTLRIMTNVDENYVPNVRASIEQGERLLSETTELVTADAVDDEDENDDAAPDDDHPFQDEFFDPLDVPPDQQGVGAALAASNTAPPGLSNSIPTSNPALFTDTIGKSFKKPTQQTHQTTHATARMTIFAPSLATVSRKQ